MPIGYLVSTLLVAWCTAFALAPPRPRHSSPSNLSYSFGFLVNELPFVAFYWLLASTLLAIGQRDIASALGWAGLAVALLAVVGLVLIVRRAQQAGRSVDRALDQTLGAHRPRRRPPYARILLAPYLMRRRDVERVANISYGDAGRWNLLDVYRPRSRPARAPVFVHLHGGAFRSGRKSKEARPLLNRLASRGWLCISANYRLSPSAQFPDHLTDAKKVIAWVREHGATYGADPSVLVVAGSSAGGNLAATAALTANDARFQPGFEGVDTSVTAAVSLYGYYGPYGDPASSPRNFVRADAPPFFVVHGDLDTIVLVDDARRFVELLRRETSSPVVYAELPGAQHTFDLFHSLRFEAVVDGIEAFVEWSRASTTD